MTSPSLSSISARLVTEDEYKMFSPVNEMMVSKKGNRLFPRLQFELDGLEPEEKYQVLISLERVDDVRYVFKKGSWVGRNKSPMSDPIKYVTYEGVEWWYGKQLMESIVDFKKLKICNKENNQDLHINVKTMHKYVPMLTILPLKTAEPLVFYYPVAEFIPVTAYADQQISTLKGTWNGCTTIANKKRRAEADAGNVENGKLLSPKRKKPLSTVSDNSCNPVPNDSAQNQNGSIALLNNYSGYFPY